MSEFKLGYLRKILRNAGIVGIAALASLSVGSAWAQNLWYKPPTFKRVELAYRGDARAQAWLGYLYEKGIGVPQNAEKAVYWYHCAADRGQPHAQFLLGMAHDLGRGAPQDYVLAYAWTNQAVARAQGQLRRDWVRIRHSIASKLSLKEMTDAQRLTLDDLRGPDCTPGSLVKGG